MIVDGRGSDRWQACRTRAWSHGRWYCRCNIITYVFILELRFVTFTVGNIEYDALKRVFQIPYVRTRRYDDIDVNE